MTTKASEGANDDRQTAMQNWTALGADAGWSIPALQVLPVRQNPLLVGHPNLSFFVPKADEWINSNQRLHRMVKANRVKSWRESAAEAVPPNWPPFDHPVRIVAEVWKNRRGRYDPNNLNTTTKACVDGFVDAGLLVDDDWEHVLGPDHRHGGVGEPGIIFHFFAHQGT